MKHQLAILALALSVSAAAVGQTAPPSGQKTLAASMNIYAFPGNQQTPAQQSADEMECYNFAVQSTGADPFTLQKEAEKQKKETEEATKQASKADQGSGAKGAVAGAA